MTLNYPEAIGALLAALAVSLVSLTGAFILWLPKTTLERVIPYQVAVAVGVLLGDAFLHLIPDAIERCGSAADVCLATLAGVFLFFTLEKAARWHHQHTLALPAHAVRPTARMNLMGDAVHNFVDGILIAGSFNADPWLGLTTTLAIMVHELPQELSDVGVLICAGLNPQRAVFCNFICSLTVIVGVLFTLLLEEAADRSLIWLLPIAAGGFIYIATSDFIPLLHDQQAAHPLGQASGFAMGIALMQAVPLFETWIHTLQ